MRYFGKMDEAVTEKLARLFMAECLPDIDGLDEYAEEYGKDPEGFVISRATAYGTEVSQLNNSQRELYKVWGDTFGWKDSEDVFLEFTRPYFTGKSLDLARLLKSVYPNLTFEEMGRLTIHNSPTGEVK